MVINVSRLAIALTFLLMVTVARAVPITVGSYVYADGSGLPGGDLGAAMTDAANFANFGYSGVIDGGEVAFGGITGAYLDTIDLFFTDRSAIGIAPSAGDIAALTSWVNDGGVLIVNNDRSTSFTSLDPLLNAFGIDLVEAPTNALEMLSIDEPAHPIMNGPFGTVNSMSLRDASRFTALDAGVTTLSSWQNGDAAILVREAAGLQLGAVIVLPDVERFLLDLDNGLGTGDTDIATLNAIAYATSVALNPTSAVPVPAAVWLFGSALAGLLGFQRRRASVTA